MPIIFNPKNNNQLLKSMLTIFAGLLAVAIILLTFPIALSQDTKSAYDPYVDGPMPMDIDAVPPPVVPCLESALGYRDPEFHSLRPYQASPCGNAPKAYFCSNDYTIIEDVSMTWNYGDCAIVDGAYICIPPANTTVADPNSNVREPAFIIGGADGRDYYITLSRAQYPIMGNTQDVINSQSPLDTFDATQKMNEYVNWYLQGVTDKAEYGDLRLPNHYVSYGGPTKKLLPQDFLNFRRLGVLHDAGTHPHPPLQLDPTEYQGTSTLVDPTTGQIIVDETTNHNQIAVCVNGASQAIPCWRGDGSPSLGSGRRLVSWWEGKGSTPSQTFYNWGPTDVWRGLTPPFAWQFTNTQYYMKSYLEWKGYSCLIVAGGLYCSNMSVNAVAACDFFADTICKSIPGFTAACIMPQVQQSFSMFCQAAVSSGSHLVNNYLNFCTDLLSPLGTIGQAGIGACQGIAASTLGGVGSTVVGSTLRKEYADMYRFIPLGNATDKNAAHMVTGFRADAPGKTKVIVLDYDIERNPVLHYPHTESTVQASNLLNQVHTPLSCTTSAIPGDVSPRPDRQTACCDAGFTFSNDTCVNNNVKSTCDTFASSVCKVASCSNTSVSLSCQKILINGGFHAQDPTVICNTLGLLNINDAILLACRAAVEVVRGAFSNLVTTHTPLCEEGFTCQNNLCAPQGQNAAAKLKCRKITGFGTKFEPTTCEFVDVRTNAGDSLTFNNPPSYLFVNDAKTRVVQIECQNKGQLDQFFAPPDGGCGGITWNRCLTDACNPSQCGGSCPDKPGIPSFCTHWPPCTAEVRITIPTVPKIPYIDKIWKNTVVDKNTSFRRIFPKLEKDAPVSCIKEIPGMTPLLYISGRETNLTQISTAGPFVFAGNGPSSVSPGQIFFPHLGTIYEYFLKGIQTALRPKGYGSPIPQGDPAICEADGLPGACKQWLFETDNKGQRYYDKIIDTANSTSCNGKTLNPYWAIAIALNENGGLMSEDPEGESNSHFGCRMTQVETIEDKISCMANTLRSDCAAGKTDEQTLQEYGYAPGYIMWPITVLDPGGAYPPPLFGTGFDIGTLLSNLLNTDWVASYASVARIFCPNSSVLQPSTK